MPAPCRSAKARDRPPCRALRARTTDRRSAPPARPQRPPRPGPCGAMSSALGPGSDRAQRSGVLSFPSLATPQLFGPLNPFGQGDDVAWLGADEPREALTVFLLPRLPG